MKNGGQTRRAFLKGLAALGAGPVLFRGRPGGFRSRFEETGGAGPQLVYKARTLSVGRFKDLQNDIDTLRREKKLSFNERYLKYIDNRKFAVPPGFPGAASAVIIAYRTPMLRLDFNIWGRAHEIIISPQYFDDGLTRADLEAAVRRDIVKDPAARLEPAQGLHLKLLAVRSGLGRYGRNNICFVDGMGSFVALFAFLTDAAGLEDSWRELSLLETCRDCSICYGICPSNAIRRENFVIDAGRCISLYNEVEGAFPSWILPTMHSALMGCMKCQLGCPENQKVGIVEERGEDVNEEETRKILEGRPDDELLKSLGRKLRGFPPAMDREQFPLLVRNLGVLLRP